MIYATKPLFKLIASPPPRHPVLAHMRVDLRGRQAHVSTHIGLRHWALSDGLCFSLAFRRAGLCFLSLPVPAADLARSCDWVTGGRQTATRLPRST
jgi:hypothetical protein